MNEKISVVICAAGSGKRAGFEKNKLLVPLLGISLLERSISAFLSVADEIVLSVNARDLEEVTPLANKYGALLTQGGDTRTQSVYNALRKVTGDIVLVHDGARPYVTAEVIQGCIDSVRAHESGICAIPVVDTIVTTKGNAVQSYPDRQNTYAVQTPQGFYTKELLSAYERAFSDGKTDFTDDSSLYSSYVRPPVLCKGDKKNVKLTYREDFYVAANRVGFGVDTHAFGKTQDFIVLGGVQIPSETGLIAHSDGDVLIHAVMDALLSAAGLYDIGHYFPDTDERYENANSTELLQEVVRLIEREGLRPFNLSVAVQAEKPRLAKYIDAIKNNLSNALSLPLSAVGVSAGTNEKLGYVGEGKGITVYATVLLTTVEKEN